MRRLALLGALALLATACGSGKPAATAADVAPRSTIAFVTLTRTPNPNVLFLTDAGTRLETLAFRAASLRFTPRVQVALLPQGPVAYALPEDRKAFERTLDRHRVLHARVHGWEVFARTRSALDAARHVKETLASAPWFRAAARAVPKRADVVAVERGWRVVSASGDSISDSQAGRGRSGTIAATAAIPADAVAAFAWHDAAPVIRSLPIATQLREGVGLTLDDLAAAAPGDAVFYARAGVPLPGLTLLADRGTLAAARRIVHDLDPGAPPPFPATVDGHTLEDVGFSALDLYYGRVGRTVAITDDAGASLVRAPHPLAVDGLPKETVGWMWVDLVRAVPELRKLASLAGTTVHRRALQPLAGFRTILEYVTAGGGVRTTTIVAR